MLGNGDNDWDDGINYKAISCEKIPDLFLDKLVAKKHFSKFGKITRFILRPSRQSCTVEYETEAQAERALDQAGEYNGQEFKVEYARRDVAHVQNTEEWVNPEVQAELEAMGVRQPLATYKTTSATTAMLPPPMPLSAASSQSKSLSSRSQKLMTGKQIQQPIQTPPIKIDMAMRQEYEAILRRPAYTDEEKYRVLDARDKLMRLIRPRQTDIKKVESTKGICPDMCPEKERLMREFQRQVSTFETCNEEEVSESSISHQRAIKEYSRSSADQEVPLSHELRPESVLKMTMLYLMHRIMDLCNDPQISLADWFHFVWDRTRSIRKDITQQELCSLGTVQLVEQCARFHIHCAARLVAEDPSVFDKKINAENLTKCLQSLKYMYHDLRIKGVHCPCEPEFRSYIILLNMGDSNFLWELKQLPEHIQNSKEIKQAIAFYNALQNNNYVRFFSMIRDNETSYLSACILLGYFNKLRWRAMEAINKSHNWRKNAVLLPLAYLTRILGFEDEEAAADYFTYHGLKCSGQRVLLDRLQRPDIEYAMDRAMNLVESKRTASVGECVCGHTLESAEIFERHVPHNSFDDNGLLKDIAWSADDQLRGEAAKERRRQRELEKLQQLQQEISKAQKRTNSPPLILPPPSNIQPPAIRTDDSIFKVPMATSSISPKQQQRQQQQQQQQFKASQLPQKSSESSIFGSNRLAEMKKLTTNQKPNTLASFKFDNPQATTNSNSFSSLGRSVFGAAAAKDKSGAPFKTPFATTSATSFGDAASSLVGSSIFGGNAIANVQQAASSTPGGFIFHGGSKGMNGDSIFSSAAKSTASIFQQNASQQPQPMANDSVFQHFNKQSVLSGFGQQSTNIFGSSSIPFKQTSASPTDGWSDAEEDEAVAQAQAQAEVAAKLEEQRELERQNKEQQMLKEKAAVEQRRAEAERQRQQLLKELEKQSERMTGRELDSYVAAEVASIAKNELDKYKNFESQCQHLADAQLLQYITMQVDEIVNEEYALMCHDQLMLRRYFERWLRYARKKQHQRILIDSTPIWVTTGTRAELAAKLMHPNVEENMQMIKRYRHGEPCNFKLLLWKHPDTVAAPRMLVDIFEVVRAHNVRQNAVRRGHLQQHKYFKLLLSLPTDTDELPGFESLCNKWLQKHVKRCATNSNSATGQEPEPEPEQVLVQAEGRERFPYICDSEGDVALCVRKVRGTPPVAESGQVARHECDHADAIVCLMTCDNIQSTRKRIHYLIKLSRLHKSIPVAFVVYDGQYTDELELSDILEMESLVGDATVSAYKFFGCLKSKNEFSFPQQFGRALRYVAEESSLCSAYAESLEMQRLQSWLDACLGEELWQRWQHSAEQNPCFAKICSAFEYVVQLYNEAVQRVIRLASEDFEESPELAEELRKFVPKLEVDMPLGLEYFPKDWQSPQRQQQITKFLQRLLLTPITEQLPTPSSATVEDWELWLLKYGSACIPHDEDAATTASYQAIKALIEQLNRPELADIEISARFQAINFLSILKPIAYAQILAVLKEYVANAKSINYKLPIEVIYDSQALENYLEMPWWLNTEAVEQVKIDYSTVAEEKGNSDIQQSTEMLAAPETLSNEALAEIIKQAQKVSRKTEEKLYALKKQTINTDTTDLSRYLDASIYQFELAKEIGAYDVSFVAKLDENEEVDITQLKYEEVGAVGGSVVNEQQTNVHPRKRKITADAEENLDEMAEVMKRAFNVIKKMESAQDRTQRALYNLDDLE